MARVFATATKNFKRWTADDDDQLKTMIKRGKNSEQIARSLGRTRASIMGRKSFLGIEDKMTPARGSDMPYTSFARVERKKKGATPIVVEKAPVLKNNLKEEMQPELIKSTIGSTIDSIIEKAKTMGLKVKISLESED
jgi:hypothetical protein